MRRAIILGVVLMLCATGSAAAASVRDDTVRIRGENRLQINQRIQSTLSFHDRAQVSSGGTVTWVVQETTGEPHTVTIADAADLPQTFDEVFECFGPDTACEPAFGHFDEEFNVVEPVLDVGEEGLDQVGDSLFIEPGGEVSAVVSAPAGTTLSYICAIHPWMQGEIRVRR
jgi:plastocyanin